MSDIPTIAPKRKIYFREMLLAWHNEQNTRKMPWKGETDPYKVWLSEIILQQTRVQQGWQYYERFIINYPTVKHLASAADDDVFKLWEGLGYYSRCRNLLLTARYIAYELNGIFPHTYEAILQLKGVGPYTAAAIASFAYGLPHAVVDGNVYRVLARWFGIEMQIDTPAARTFFTNLANECLDSNQPATYNQSIMDFGATICMPASPLCSKCPLQSGCVAYQQHKVNLLPVKGKAVQKTTRWFTYFIIRQGGKMLVRKRTGKDIWQNLHEFYLETTIDAPVWSNDSATCFLEKKMNTPVTIEAIATPIKQLLTHQTIFITFIRASVSAGFEVPEGYFLKEENELSQLAFPKPLFAMLKQHSLSLSLF